MDQEKLEELKAEHGDDIYVLTTDDEEHSIVVKAPTKAQFDRFGATAADDKKAVPAMRQLVQDCTVYPGRDELKAIFDKLPGLPMSFGQELTRIAGANRGVSAKKA